MTNNTEDLSMFGAALEQTARAIQGPVAISSDLMKHIEPLLTGSVIERVDTEEQFSNAVELCKNAKRCLAELTKEKEAVVGPKWDAYKEANGIYTPKVKALESLVDNLETVTGGYVLLKKQQEEKRIALEKQKKDDEEKAKLDAADQKLRDEQKLRDDAKAKADLAALEKDPAKKDALEQAANASAAAADTAINEAATLTKEANEAAERPVYAPLFPAAKGFSAKYKYTARITDEKKALKVLLEKYWGDLKGQKLTNLIQAACNKIAKRDEKDFKMDGAEKVETPDAKVDARKPDDSRRSGKAVEQAKVA